MRHYTFTSCAGGRFLQDWSDVEWLNAIRAGPVRTEFDNRVVKRRH